MSYTIKYTSEQVTEAIVRLQAELRPYLQNDPIIVVVMTGGVYLSSRLLFDLNTAVDIRYVKATSYTGKQQGEMHIDEDMLGTVNNREVVVIDDICDSGTTVNRIHHLLREQGAASVEYFTLLKRACARTDEGVSLHYGIYDDSGDFFVGCGLDDNGVGRNLPYVGVID